MTLFPPDVLEAAGIATKPALRVSTKYMETFLPVRPVSSGTELHPFENESGVIDLYSVGTDAQVRRLRRGQAAAAPYEETRLGITAAQLYIFVPADGGADTPSVFGLDGKGGLTLSAPQPDGSYLQRPCQPDRATQAIRRFLGVRGSTGRVYVNVRLDDGRLATNSYDPIGQKWAGEVWVPVHGPDGKDAIVKDIAVAANNPVQSALFAIGSDDEVLFAEDSFRTSTLRKLGRKASRLAVVTDARNLLCVFALDAITGLLWVKRQRAHSTQGIQFDDWIRVDASQDRKLLDVRANLRLDNAVEVFAFDDAGSLRHTRELTDPKGKPVGWQVLFPISEQPTGSIFATARNSSGYAEAYTVTSHSEIYRFWQSPESEQWFSEHLEIAQSADELISVPTHATEVIVVDDAGQPVGDADVVVNASFLSTLWVNGLAYRASMVDPVRLKTPANGKLVLHQRANALAGATLLIDTPQTQAGAPLVVEPNSQLQEKLAGMNAAAILDAKDSAKQPLLPIGIKDREKIAESIAQITKRSMDIAQADQPGSRVEYKFAPTRRAGFEPRLNLASLGETAWEISFAHGYPQYRDITVAEALAFRQAKLDAGDGELGGFFGIDWGSVWSAVKSGVEWVVDGISKIVVTIIDGIAKVLFEIAGKVFEAILEVVQQAFDFVEGIWNWLKVTLEKLYEWLAFLFNLKDFARTADGVEHTVGVMLDFTADAVHYVRDQVDNGFGIVKDRLKQIVDELVEYLNSEGNPQLGPYCAEHRPDDDQSYAADHNIFYNALEENQDRIRATGGEVTGASSSSALDDVLSGLLEKMQALANNFEFGDGKAAFDQAYGYFDSIGSQPSRALELLLSGLARVLEGVALFALDFARGVVLSLFDLIEAVIRLVREAMFARWQIPVVSQLYALFTGKSLTVTPVEVVGWSVAIPFTILSKVVLDRAPFPDDEALDDFRKTFTVDMLRSRIGLGEETEAHGVAAWDPRWKENFLIAYCCTMFVRALGEPGQVVGNATGQSLGEAAIVPIVLRFMSTGFTAPWALSAAAGAPSCTPGEPGFGVTIWMCQLICGPTRGFLLFKQKLIEGKPKLYLSELTLTLWGGANFAMSTWNFVAGPKTTASKLAFARGLTAILPGQTLRFLSLPDLNKPAKFIPVGVLAILIPVGYLGSIGAAIADITTSHVATAELAA